LSHQLSFMITAETYVSGELLLLPPFFSSLTLCRFWLHAVVHVLQFN
jgi:hypothetical protein